MAFQRSSKPRLSIRKRLAQVELEPPWGLLGVTNALSVLFLAVILLGTTVSTMLSGGKLDYFWLVFGWTLGNALVIAYVWVSRHRSQEDWQALALKGDKSSIPLILLISFGMRIAIDLIMASLSGSFSVAPEVSGLVDSPLVVWLLAIVFMVFIRPIAEELVFRGIVLPYLRFQFKAWLGLFLSALIYGLLTYLIYGSGYTILIGLIAPLLLGLYYGAVRVITGSTSMAILAHMASAFFAILTAFFLQN
ncbi:hypothetical protein MASR2M15_23780 [Anaerolineales bacterium]